MKSTNNLCLLLLLFSATQGIGQALVSIRVVDSETGRSLPLAHITIKNKKRGTVTDQYGYFVLPEFARNTDTLVVSYMGYQTLYMPVASLTGGQEIRLTPRTEWLPEMVVRGADFDIAQFMAEVAEEYQQNRPARAHIAQAFFERYTKINHRFAEYTAATGYVVFFGDSAGVSRLALYDFLAARTNKTFRAPALMQKARRYRQWGYTDLPLSGGTGLNAWLYFETVGPLGHPGHFSYKIDSVFLVGGQEVLSVAFKAKPVFLGQTRQARGTLQVATNSKRLLSVSLKGDFIWSPVWFIRLPGELSIRFAYYQNRPFLAEVKTATRKKQVEEVFFLRIRWQNFADLEVKTTDELFAIKMLANNPVVIPDSSLYRLSILRPDWASLHRDLGYPESLWEQNLSFSQQLFFYQTGQLKVDTTRLRQAREVLARQAIYFQ